MKDAASIVRDKHNLSNEWFNSDFKNTKSYSPKLVQYSKHYRTYSNIVDIRTISGEYLIAMKLMAGRPYKNNLSDTAEIVAEHQKRGMPISKESIMNAINELYNDSSQISDASLAFLEQIYQTQNIDQLIQERKAYEKRTKNTLLSFEKNYEHILNDNNLHDILKTLENKKNSQNTDAISNKAHLTTRFSNTIATFSRISENDESKDLNKSDDPNESDIFKKY